MVEVCMESLFYVIKKSKGIIKVLNDEWCILKLVSGCLFLGLKYKLIFDWFEGFLGLKAFIVCCDFYVIDDLGMGVVY